MQDNSTTGYNLLVYTSCMYSFAESISSTQQKQTKRVGRGRGVCHPFAKNPRQPPYPCSCLISLAPTTDKLIFESCVLVTYLTWALTSGSSIYLYPSRLARVIFALTDTYHCLNRQTAAHSLDLTNYKLSKYTETFTSPQYRLTYHTIKQAIMHSKVAARSKA